MKKFEKHYYDIKAHIGGLCEVWATNFRTGVVRIYSCESLHLSDELRHDEISNTRWDEIRRTIMRIARAAQTFHDLPREKRLALGWTYNPYRASEGVRVL